MVQCFCSTLFLVFICILNGFWSIATNVHKPCAMVVFSFFPMSWIATIIWYTKTCRQNLWWHLVFTGSSQNCIVYCLIKQRKRFLVEFVTILWNCIYQIKHNQTQQKHRLRIFVHFNFSSNFVENTQHFDIIANQKLVCRSISIHFVLFQIEVDLKHSHLKSDIGCVNLTCNAMISTNW